MEIKNEILEEILPLVRKPARYLGNELNAVRKDPRAQKVRFAICFPDLYEIGMSNLGLRIIYGLLNSLPEVSCERVFLPDVDMREILKTRKIPLFSLESKTVLSEFDFIGFCLSCELSYTNMLAVLDLSGIPLLAKDRNSAFPLIIAGGASVGNPEPAADFVDLFLIGEAEEALPEVIERYKESLINPSTPRSKDRGLLRIDTESGVTFPRPKGRGLNAAECIKNQKSKITKEEALRELAGIKGVYVPSLYEVEYDARGVIKEFRPKYPDIPVRIRKRVVEDLNQAYYPVDWIVPYIQIVHDRAAIELMRGCPYNCNFCQARSVYSGLRLRSPEKVLELVDKISRSSGYEEFSFLSLSTSSYPYLRDIVVSVSDKFQKQAIAISLPSLRPKSYLGVLAEYLAKVRKTTLTFAPEAGSERLREAINKNFSMEEFYSAISSAYKAGWQAIKLYFMIGLPDETSQDFDGILEIAQKVSKLRLESAGRPAQVRLSISFFVPKPHTFFEREKMENRDKLKENILYLKNKARKLSKKITLDFHNLETSILEAVLSRSDRSLGEVILRAYNNGCLLDGWPEHFKHELWLKAFKESGKDFDFYLRERSADEILPWQHIDVSA
ncbi:MAG: radical SAM protein [Candidatus Omnitrophota bacterium]